MQKNNKNLLDLRNYPKNKEKTEIEPNNRVKHSTDHGFRERSASPAS